MEIISGLLTGVGGVTGLILFGVLLVIVLGAVWIGQRFGGAENDILGRVTRLAGTAVMAVEKLSDNKEFEGLPPAQRSAAKKAKALEIIELGLRAEGISPNAAIMGLAGFAIEAVLKNLEAQRESSAEA